MAEQSRVKSVHSLVSLRAQACLADLLATGEVPRPVTAVHQGGGWTVLLIAMPTFPRDLLPELTLCDRDCLGLLAQAQQPLSAARVRRQLEVQNVAIWAEITVKRSLAKLHRLGLLANSRKSPRGYWLLGNFPLFRHALDPATSAPRQKQDTKE